MTVPHRRVRRAIVPLVSSAFIALALPPVSVQRPDSGPVYRFTVDYFNFGANGDFRSKQRVLGDYHANADGTVEWRNVGVASAQTIDAVFGSGDAQAFMNGFRYRPGADTTRAEFFKGFPPNATQQQNLVWDTLMFESFARDLPKVTGDAPYRFPSSNVPLAGTGNFQNRNIELTRTGTIERNGQPLAVLHYEAFFNRFNMDVPGGMKLTGRSDYWGDIWLAPATNAIDRATLFEEVVGELKLPSQPNPMIVNVVRRGSFERIVR
jgi:hypothetical protein